MSSDTLRLNVTAHRGLGGYFRRFGIFFDALSIAIGVFVAAFFTAADQRIPFLLFLGTWAFVSWIGLLRWNPQFPTVRNQYYHLLFAPLTGSVLTLLTTSVFRTYYSLTAITWFVAISTLLFFLFRVAIQRRSPAIQAAVLGVPFHLEEFSNNPMLNIIQLTQPQSLKGFDVVILSKGDALNPDWAPYLTRAELAKTPMYSDPVALELFSRKIDLRYVAETSKTELESRLGRYAAFKRLFDICAVIILSPFILAIAGLIYAVLFIMNDNPVIFRQERVGKDGKPFTLYKFRTMKLSAEDDGAAFADTDDPRITPFGSLLRKMRLDELPQFWNVLKGDMSIIGPRPEQKVFVEEFDKIIPGYNLRHLVKPGISGWAQVMHGYAAGEVETREKLSYDLYYVKHFSGRLDLSVVMRTLATILTGFGAR